MARKKRRTRRGTVGTTKRESKALRKARGKRHGSKSEPTAKIHTLNLAANVDVWDVQKALRKDGFFARAVGPHKVATNSPMKKI